MLDITLIKPGFPLTQTVVHVTFAGDGIVLESVGVDSPKPTYFETNQDAKEHLITRAADYLRNGYRIFTGDGVTK